MPPFRALRRLGCLVAVTLGVFSGATAYDLDPNSSDSIKEISKQMAEDMVSFYSGHQPGNVPGLLPQPYYWWEAGAMMGALIEYWYYTKDDTYVDMTKQALLFQVGEHNDYMPDNQTLTEGNDDQGFWGLAVMSAAEYNFPHPEPHQPQWLALAQAVFNTQAARWDNQHCNGGLRWQIFNWNKGYDYKNSISNACFFALGARLALFTGNQTYADWAEKTWDWMMGVGFIDEEWHYVYDGAHIPTNCTNIVPYQFSYNAGGMILGAAALYNYTEDQVWKQRLDNLLEGSKVFFTGPEKNIMEEVACEPVNLCNIDQQSFKAYLSRWFAAITKWAPDTYDFVMPYLQASAVAAAKQCTGGDNGRMCGLKWSEGTYDGSTGVGQQMAAMEVALSCMIRDRDPPLTSGTGGTSHGDPNAGGTDIGRTTPADYQVREITLADKVGAGILTWLVIGGLFAGILWIILDETSNKSAIQQIMEFPRAATAASVSIAALASGRKATTVLQKGKGRSLASTDKLSAAVSVAQQPSSLGSLDDRSPQLPAIHIGEANSEISSIPTNYSGAASPRRMSAMPRGWPNNPSLRSSTLTEPDGSRSPAAP